jgi:hypothetical protein
MSANTEPKVVPNPVEVVEDVVETPAEEAVEVTIETPVEDAVKAPETKVPSNVGVVSGCDKLRVRKAPSLSAGVVCIINESSAVVIDDACSTTEFYKVCTEAGVEGYCMKKFITVKA